jgi:hypothetical protein
MRAIYAAIGGAALGVWLASCVAQAPQMVKRDGDDLKQEVTALWTQIRDWRFEAGMNVEPANATKMSMRGQTVAIAKRVCPTDPEPASDHCADVCDLASAICENAGRICEIADELQRDPWAVDKCTSATASCREAKQRCCDCDDDPDGQAALFHAPGM